jgi:hypothetical protein
MQEYSSYFSSHLISYTCVYFVLQLPLYCPALLEWRNVHVFLTSALDGCERSVSRSGSFTPGKIRLGNHCRGRGVEPRTSIDSVERRKIFLLPGLELRPLRGPVSGQSLYRLRYYIYTRFRRKNWRKNSNYDSLRWQNNIKTEGID